MSTRILSFDEFLNENDIKDAKLFNVASIGYIPALILEGGAAGHMMHPFNDNSLTFGDFKKIVDGALQGKLDFEEQPTEKTDGQNLFVTIKNGKAHFARNKGQMISPLDLKGIKNMFVGTTPHFCWRNLRFLLARNQILFWICGAAVVPTEI